MAGAKVKKKRWLPIMGPKSFGNRVLGQTYVFDADSVKGKAISLNLMTVTNDPKKQNTIIKFVVDEIKEGAAYASVTGITIIPASIKRLARRGKDKIDHSFVCKTSDNKIVRLKPLIITRSMTKGSALKGLVKQVELSLRSVVKKGDYSKLVDDIVSKNIQRDLKTKLNKTYPLKICEIRAMELVQGKKAEAAEKLLNGIKEPEAKPETAEDADDSESQEEVEEKPKKPAKKVQEESPNQEIPKAPESPEDSEDF
ncbi:MAG: 40S ribosomal protein S3a/S1 [Nanoarchaeota archaeon]|nr:40S ribosomal protein S3a/S1 [Nanoarchaeota archaeon]MBU1703836.1 40S ribosomal protein S3a/S1 [Nanoarchaeota archaeon]